jgi:hypothetical protein
MDSEKKRLLEQSIEMGDVVIIKKFENPKDAFAHFFSKLDLIGIDNLLSSQNHYDGVTKQHYLDLIKQHFENLKTEGIQFLKSINGVCNGCKKGCSGFTFLDENYGFYTDLIIEVEDSEIINFMECFNLKNEIKIPNKLEQLFIKPFELDSNQDEVPF